MSNSAPVIGQFDSICRVCTKSSNKMISLFGIRKKGLMLADMLGICTRSKVKQTDRLPQNICNLCLSHLEVAFDFYNQVKSSEDRFHKILSAEEKRSQSVDFQTSDDIEKMVKVEFSEGIAEVLLDDIPHVGQKRKMTAAEFYTEQQTYDLEMHERKMRRLFECFLCKEKLKSFTDTRSHLKQHCSKLFPMLYLLECHRGQHGTIEKPHVCNICGRGFRVNFLLRKHLTTHSDERPHLCSTCGMGFKTMGTLRSHTIRHSGIKPIACSKCPKRFFSKADLRKHMDVHSDAKYICSMCGATLNSKRSLDEHRRHRHRKAEEQTCDLCSMKFRTVYNLKRHLLTHTGEKPHKCTYCDRAFAQSGDLNKHLRSHVGEKTYQCNLCYKSFRLQIELRKHSYEHFQAESKTTPEVSSS